MKGVWTKYGLTQEQYEAMKAKTNNTCYICRRPPAKRALHIDHNHKTGQVRGLLCHMCNRFLIGKMGDRPDAVELFKRAVEYLEGKPMKKIKKVPFKFSS